MCGAKRGQGSVVYGCDVSSLGAFRCRLLVFFFQAEDGIRDHCVTGVQTCALPIYKYMLRGITHEGVKQTIGRDLAIAAGIGFCPG